MNVLQSMTEKLAPLGLYGFAEDDLVMAELECYALVLQDYCDELDELLAERFVSTASGRGLELYEDMLRNYCLDETLPGRRKSVLASISMTNTDNRLADLDVLKDVFGISGSFSAGSGQITFTCTDTLTADEIAVISARMEKFMPIGTTFVFA